MLCPLPFPLLNSPSFLTSSLMNEPQTQRRGLKMYDMETSKAFQVEKDFIDIEISTSFRREFEFQMYSSSIFHVTQNLAYEDECKTSRVSSISPSEPCRGSCELWCKKMKLIKQSSITQKLKFSRAYLKSLFMKSEEEEFKAVKNQAACFTMKSILESDQMDDQISLTCHRKSFSEAIKKHYTSKCYNSTSLSTSSNSSSSSSSFSLKSTNGFYEISMLKRSTNANSEAENSIQGAIAYCKNTHLKHDNSKPKLTASERSEICRI